MSRFKKNKRTKIRYLITKLNPRSPISEQYRTIRTNLQFSSVDNVYRSVLVTSSNAEEGKSMTAANLAIIYAQQGKHTLLIDADLRRPAVHYMFQLENKAGLTNVLIGDTSLERVVNYARVEHLDILSSGPISPNPSELLSSERLKELIQKAKTLYDFIIIDTPPLSAVTDAKIMANYVDSSLLVMRSGSTHIEDAKRAIQTLKDANAKFLGAILNDIPKKKQRNNYYYTSS